MGGEGTVADKMNGQIPEQIKTERSEQLIQTEEMLGKAYRQQMIGTGQRVLFEESAIVDGVVCQVGYNERYVRIAVKTQEDLSNQIRTVLVTGHAQKEETLFGEVWREE